MIVAVVIRPPHQDSLILTPFTTRRSWIIGQEGIQLQTELWTNVLKMKLEAHQWLTSWWYPASLANTCAFASSHTQSLVPVGGGVTTRFELSPPVS